MSRDLLAALDKARDLLCTPLALEVLDDLAHGRSPYERPEKSKVITAAVRCLESLGAARCMSRQVVVESRIVEITPRGRTLYDRLVEIEEWAERQEASDGTVSSGSP
jgi:DNA-binding HxlR family transcriptional regulator